MKRIIVASKNPVKINAALTAFQLAFPDEVWDVEGVSVPSGVPDQPHGDEILQGARNRAEAVRSLRTDADFYIGLEGGTDDMDGEMVTYAWAVVMSRDGRASRSNTGCITLPTQLADLVRAGKELGEASDIVFNESNVKQSIGTTGLLTRGVVSREDSYREALVIALIPFLNPELYR